MKNYIILTLTVFTLMMPPISAQCPWGDVTLHSQQQVEDFAVNFPNCTEFPANLTIDNNSNTPIYDLSPLSNITNVIGNLVIRNNDSLNTLNGLHNITSVANLLLIQHNDNLTTMNGLESLEYVGTILNITMNDNLNNLTGLGSLTQVNGARITYNDNLTTLEGVENLNSMGSQNLLIEHNDSLSSIIGLEGLSTVEGNLTIQYNNSLTTLEGLENLSMVQDYFSITNNQSLVALSGLENLNSVGGDLMIFWNNALTTLEGLNSLSTVSDLSIAGCSSLTTMAGLESLIHIEGDMAITNNNGLTSLAGLENVEDIGGGLWLESNPLLTNCSILSVCYHLLEGGPIEYIYGNAEGCNSVEEIMDGCASVWEYAVEGNIFMDSDGNCLQDSIEQDLNNWIIKVENAQDIRYAYTYNGKYITPVDTGIYTVTAIPPNSLWEDVCFESNTAELNAENIRARVDLGASTNTFCPLLEVDVTAPFVRRCFDSNYYVRYCNSGTILAENAYIEVQLDPYFTYQSSTIEGIHLGENLYSFDLGNVDIGECGNFRIDVYVDCDSTEIGQTHCVEAHIYPDSICTSALPLWDGASIEVDAQCLGDSIEFKIENVGTGDMSDSLEYMVIEEDLTYERTNFKLNSGDSRIFYKTANGLFHRLEAEQSPGHPGNSMPSVFVEGCGTSDDGEISVGFVNYFLLDEGNAFVSIDCQENIGSYDPNDKQAFPVGYGAPHFITDSTDLEYLIRFQNTGTDTAFNIVIRDTISPHLNIETLRPGVASHDYRYDIDSSNIAVFHFENIMLPDSNINEAASHGFIKFNIEQKQNNPIGTHIMNDAAIYFDFNEPIITNEVFHTIGEDFMGIITSVITPPEVEEAGILVNVFPNPFDEYTRFEIKGEALKELNLSVYDMMGREVLQQQSTHQQHLIMKRNNLTPGVYVFRLMDEKQQLATGKLIVK